MSWVTVIWSMVAAACLTLAMMHLLVWCKNRVALGSLAFTLAALGVAGTAAGELLMMRSATPWEMGLVMRLAYVPVAVLVMALVGFVQLSFGNGRCWLAWTTAGLQGLALILNFISGQNIIYRDIASLSQLEFLGEPVSVVARAVGNPWVRVDELGNLFLLIFVADASARLWRSGEPEKRRRALGVGGAILGFILLAAGYSALVDNRVIQSPYLISLPFLGLVVVMGLELSRDVLRSGQLVRELKNSETHLLASREELDHQLQFERLVTEISAFLINIPPAEVEKRIVAAMGRVASMLGFDIAVYSLLFGQGTGLVAYVWNKPGVVGMPAHLTEKDFPWKARELSEGRDTHIRTLDDFPPEAAVDRATYERYGIKSSSDVPILVGGRGVGVFSLGSFEKDQAVPPQIIQRQRIVGDLFANAVLRAQADAALRESERRLNLAASAADLGLWSWNLRDNSLWATNRAKEIFSFAPETNVTHAMWLERVHPEERSETEAELAEAARRGGVYETEYRILRRGGEVRWVAARGEAAFDSEGKPSSMTGVVMDITQRRRAEHEIGRQRNQLAHLSRVATLSELSSALAHELNQPLAIILTNAQAALRFLAQDPPDLEEARDILTDIVSEDERAGEVIRRLRSMLKHGEFSLRPLMVNEVIEEVLQLTRSDLIGQGVMVHRDLAVDIVLVLADRIQIQQVLLNIIRNACDAMADSPADCKHLAVVTSRHGGGVRISISDTGHGLPPQPERMFESFYTTKSQGLGLGLAICRSIVGVHQGRLWAEASSGVQSSETGKPVSGATFHLELPAAEDPKP